ncbi:hypothetical protein TNCV_1881921 [Trichonephila clavipes]|nr:hypothetical protein TNCV_1881921 [Trichonephila clavipes]
MMPRSLQNVLYYQEQESSLECCKTLSEGVQISMQNYQLYVFTSTIDIDVSLYMGQRDDFLDQQWISVLFSEESRYTLKSGPGCLLIWKERRTGYNQSSIVERRIYRSGGLMFWAGISNRRSHCPACVSWRNSDWSEVSV